MFIDRDKELETLNNEYKRQGSSFTIIYVDLVKKEVPVTEKKYVKKRRLPPFKLSFLHWDSIVPGNS